VGAGKRKHTQRGGAHTARELNHHRWSRPDLPQADCRSMVSKG
jgi:hypothetical protein